MEPIIIEKREYGFDVKQGNKIADSLGYDEMLGLISALTMPVLRPCLNWMKTEEQRSAYKRFQEERQALSNRLQLLDYDKRSEVEKCKEYKAVIQGLINGQRVKLFEKMWIKTAIKGYEFSACNVVDLSDGQFIRIEIYNDDGGIHCNADLLNSSQLKELASIVYKSVIP